MSISENFSPAEKNRLHPFEQLVGFDLLSDKVRQKLKAIPPEKISTNLLKAVRTKIEMTKSKIVKKKDTEEVVKSEVQEEVTGAEEKVTSVIKEDNGKKGLQLAEKTEKGGNLTDEEAGWLFELAEDSGDIEISELARIEDASGEYQPAAVANLKQISALSKREMLTTGKEAAVSKDIEAWNKVFEGSGERTVSVFSNPQTWLNFAEFVRGKSAKPDILKNAIKAIYAENPQSMRGAIEKAGLMNDGNDGFTINEDRLNQWFAKNEARIETGTVSDDAELAQVEQEIADFQEAA